MTITAKSKANKKVTARCKVKVYQATKKIKLNSKASYTLDIGKTVTLSAKVMSPSKGAQPISWSSSNNKVAKVSTKGKVMAVSVGKTDITGQSGNKKVKVKITVKKDIPVATENSESSESSEASGNSESNKNSEASGNSESSGNSEAGGSSETSGSSETESGDTNSGTWNGMHCIGVWMRMTN